MITIRKYTRENYTDALQLQVMESQKSFVPSILESLAFAYIKPWNECFDPYLLYHHEDLIGAFYISYTPSTHDDYWIGGFFIDKRYQNCGFGKAALKKILEFIKVNFANCEIIQLTVEKNNTVAMKFYESFGFTSTGDVNRDDEIKYQYNIKEHLNENII